jgi:DNA ligase-1
MNRLNEILPGGTLGLDGEIVSYTNGRMDSLHRVQSKVMAVHGEFDFTFHVFDDFSPKNLPYTKRHESLTQRLDPAKFKRELPFVELVENRFVNDLTGLSMLEEDLVMNGWEGMIGRKPTGFYKYGRATTNEGLLLKFKRFEDAEAVIIGYEELEHNENEATIDARGLTKRSSHKENKVAGGVLGALLLDWNGIQFKVGTGFDEDQRREIWTNSEEFMGRTVTFKYKGTGPNGKPLIAAFKSFRDDIDLPKPEQPKKAEQGSLF